MGRNLSPVLRQEVANLDKNGDGPKSKMGALRSDVKDIDSEVIPLFLAQVSKTKDLCSSSGEHTISLYEVLARVHGPNIVPQIDNIMCTIIKTLKSSAGSFPLQQACSKVVPAIARYGIDPSTPEDKKGRIIRSLCKPLSDSLLGLQESLSFGAALCLKALVDSDNWRFASDDMVNEVCLRVAGALEEKPTQTNAHMGLAMALGKQNSLTVEAYARSLIRSGLRILNAGVAEDSSKKRLSAIQMVNFLMKCVDPRSIFSDLGTVIEEMEKCHSDKMEFVKGAAFEALQTARIIIKEKRSRVENELGSVTGSNFGRRENRRKHAWDARLRSPVSASPESQTVYSFIHYDSLDESPMSTGRLSYNFDYDNRSVSRKLWKNENGGVDVSLKDGFFTDVVAGSKGSKTYSEQFEDGEISDDGDHSEAFSGFEHSTPRNGVTRSTTPSPQRSPLFNIDNTEITEIFTTPRKLICSLQYQSDVNSDFSDEQTRRNRSPASSHLEWSPTRKLFQNDLNYEANDNEKSESGEQEPNGSESVSSTGHVATDADCEVSHELVPEGETGIQSLSIKWKRWKVFLSFISGIFILFAVITSVIWIDSWETLSHFTPT